jgi:hypothetical protein
LSPRNKNGSNEERERKKGNPVCMAAAADDDDAAGILRTGPRGYRTKGQILVPYRARASKGLSDQTRNKLVVIEGNEEKRRNS